MRFNDFTELNYVIDCCYDTDFELFLSRPDLFWDEDISKLFWAFLFGFWFYFTPAA